ncbi:MAG: class I SAM-dependent methyltransferase [Nitrospinota bacterium]|nr:MAG: class I SAM-dependent methyltransferase [Nitrospinota bacterium]
MRLGTYYRSRVMQYMGIVPRGGYVLDVGSFDGYYLSLFPHGVRIGVDLHVSPAARIPMVCADACALPFPDEVFDTIYAFDVIEHVRNKTAFIDSLLRVLKPGGLLVLSTPHKGMRLFPASLTARTHWQWGHREPGYDGYGPEEIAALLPPGVKVTFRFWPAPCLLKTYFLLRFCWRKVSPVLAKPLVFLVAWCDKRWKDRRLANTFMLVAHIEKQGSSPINREGNV